MELKGLSTRPLEERLGDRWCEARRVEENTFVHKAPVTVFSKFHRLLDWGGLGAWGFRNFLSIRIEEEEWRLNRDRKQTESIRIVQLTDLHLDLEPKLTPIIAEILSSVQMDLLCITGDFQDRPDADLHSILELMRQILDGVRAPVIGIPGNHDRLDLLSALEGIGVHCLLNESCLIHKNRRTLQISGVDDGYRFTTWSLPAVRESPALLLSHTPAMAKVAEKAGYDWMLAGHTHGGQICLPGGFPIVRAGVEDRDLIAGRWQRQQLQGYTSRGTGACHIPVRFFCPPEITVHTVYF